MNHLRRLALAAGTAIAMTSSPAATPPQRLFVSGHSLVDQPLPSYLASIAASQGTPIQWNRQYMVGSSMKARARGLQAATGATGWDGYRQGYNRDGENLDVLAEWRAPRTVNGGPYDALLVTEQHGLLGTLLWNDSVRYLRHVHDRFVQSNAAARTWFYESWISLDDKSDPRRWIAYERAASPVWQCMAARVNASLAAERRPDRIEPLPAGWALAYLIERATTGGGVEGVSAASVGETVSRIVADDVHLTKLGAYYVALVSYGSLFGRAAQAAWAPPEVQPSSALALQRIAWEALEAERIARRPKTLEACRAYLQGEFIALYWGYIRDAYFRRESGTLHAWWRWARLRVEWHWRLRENAPDHPLRFDPATDASYWFKGP